MSNWSFDPSPVVPGQPCKICLTNMDAIPVAFTADFGPAGTVLFEIAEVSMPCAWVDIPQDAIAGNLVDGAGIMMDQPVPF